MEEKLFLEYRNEERADILIENTAFGAGGEQKNE